LGSSSLFKKALILNPEEIACFDKGFVVFLISVSAGIFGFTGDFS
jgi:hypothetical protein